MNSLDRVPNWGANLGRSGACWVAVGADANREGALDERRGDDFEPHDYWMQGDQSP